MSKKKTNITKLQLNIAHELSIFKLMTGNRTPNVSNIKRLAKSIEEHGMLCNPILVNEKMEVIDGQHRLLAAKETSSPVYYIVAHGYGIEQVQALNINQSNWGIKEYMESFAAVGVESYVLLANFVSRHPCFSIEVCLNLCANTSSKYTIKRPINKTGNVVNKKKDFNRGTWLVKDMAIAEKHAFMLKAIKPYFHYYAQRSFVLAMLFMFNHKNYNHDKFINKLKLQPTALERCANGAKYKELIEKIYNYKSRNKVNLRY